MLDAKFLKRFRPATLNFKTRFSISVAMNSRLVCRALRRKRETTGKVERGNHWADPIAPGSGFWAYPNPKNPRHQKRHSENFTSSDAPPRPVVNSGVARGDCYRSLWPP